MLLPETWLQLVQYDFVVRRVLSRIQNLGGGTNIDNVAVGGGCGRGVCPLPREVRKLRHFMILKRLNFNSCVISTGIIELKKAYVLSQANHLGVGEASPPSPSR